MPNDDDDVIRRAAAVVDDEDDRLEQEVTAVPRERVDELLNHPANVEFRRRLEEDVAARVKELEEEDGWPPAPPAA
jgi:hypothetical protein